MFMLMLAGMFGILHGGPQRLIHMHGSYWIHQETHALYTVVRPRVKAH